MTHERGVKQRMKRALIFIALPIALSGHKAYSQKLSYADSLNKVIQKTFKGKHKKITDLIDDSTARTFEYYRKSKKSLLACFKSIHNGITTEMHFYFLEEKLLKVYVTILNRVQKNIAFDAYYPWQNRLVLANLSPPEGNSSYELLRLSGELLERSRVVGGNTEL